MYMTGLLTHSCESSLSYDTDSGNEYWKVKNSWCVNTMARRHDLHHHGGVLYSETNLCKVQCT